MKRNIIIKVGCLALWLSLTPGVEAQQQARIPEADRIRLAEAFRIGEKLGNHVWDGWDKAPFAVLLITSEHEFLVRHPRPTPDFISTGYDSLLHSHVHFRNRTQPTHFLATYPAVAGISTIVIGQAENTAAKTSTLWVVTLLHEHFHQLQDSQPNYYAEVDSLQLARGDQTGMWMLNFPFPYSDTAVTRQFSVLSRLLAEMIGTQKQGVKTGELADYLEARRSLEKMISPDEYRYLSFQLWKEGVARYTEYRIARLAGQEYQPGRAFLALPDYRPFAEVAGEILTNIRHELTTRTLAEFQREMVYPFGAAEALLLDEIHPDWRNRYFTEKFNLKNYFEHPR